MSPISLFGLYAPIQQAPISHSQVVRCRLVEFDAETYFPFSKDLVLKQGYDIASFWKESGRDLRAFFDRPRKEARSDPGGWRFYVLFLDGESFWVDRTGLAQSGSKSFFLDKKEMRELSELVWTVCPKINPKYPEGD